MRKLLPFGITAALVAMLALGGAQAANAAVFCVTSPLDTSDVSTSDGECKDALGLCTLRAAIEQNNASGGNTIKLYGGVYPLTSGKELKITKDVTITAASVLEYLPFATWVTGCDATRVFNIACGAKVSIKGLTITNGYAKYGAGIFNSGDLTIEQSLICDNVATAGLFEYYNGAFSTDAFGGGGGIFNKCKLTVKWCDIQNNEATVGAGGGIANFMESSLAISFSSICDNEAAYAGDGIDNNGTMTIDVTTLFIHNGDDANPLDDCEGSSCPTGT
jgi:hypothetical protein